MPSRAALAKIHIAKKALVLDDDSYRAVLHLRYKKSSAAELSDRQAADLIEHFKHLGFTPTRKKGRPQNMACPISSRAAQLAKIEALLTVGKRPWSYADALAKRICKVDRVAWVPDTALGKIIAALSYQAKREGWEAEGGGRLKVKSPRLQPKQPSV